MLTNWNDTSTANPFVPTGRRNWKIDNLMTNSPKPSLPGASA